MIEIRPASTADIPTIVSVIRAAFAEYAGQLDPPTSAETKTVESTRQELVGGGALVAHAEQTLAGCVFYHQHADHMYLDRLAVLPEYRRQGLAGHLIAAVEEQARHCGLGQVRLAVRLALAENRSYYERLGYAFFKHGTHAGYPEPTYVTLQKQLKDSTNV